MVPASACWGGLYRWGISADSRGPVGTSDGAPSPLGGRVFFYALYGIGDPGNRRHEGGLMPTARKIEQVADLKDRIGRAEIAIAASYQGTSVAEQVALRQAIHEVGGEMRVVKNTLLKIAATDAGLEQFAELADGPTAIVFGYDEPVAPARALVTYLREHENSTVEIRRAVVNGELVDAAYVNDLATVPPREELLARIAGGLVAKIRELMMLLDGTTREFAGLVEARAAQLESEGPAESEAVAEPEAAAEAAPVAEVEPEAAAEPEAVSEPEAALESEAEAADETKSEEDNGAS
jgi:large subunit ribosomal protein L10